MINYQKVAILLLFAYLNTTNNFLFATTCLPKTNDTNEWIDKISIGNYQLEQSMSNGFETVKTRFTFDASKEYSITLTPGFRTAMIPEGWAIFIDLNHDNDFDDDHEVLLELSPESGTITSAFQWYIPGMKSDTYTVRIGMKYNDIPFSCSFDEKADYVDFVVDLQAPSLLIPQEHYISGNSISVAFDDDIGINKDVVLIDENNQEYHQQSSSEIVTFSDLQPNKEYTIKAKSTDELLYSVPFKIKTLATNSTIKIEDKASTIVSSPIIFSDPSSLNEAYNSREKRVHKFSTSNPDAVVGIKVNYCELQANNDYLIASSEEVFSIKNLNFYLTGDVAKGRTFFSNSSEVYFTFMTNASQNFEGFEVVVFEALPLDQEFSILPGDNFAEIVFDNNANDVYTLELQDNTTKEFSIYTTTSDHYLIEGLSKSHTYKVKIRKDGYAFGTEKTFATLSSAPQLLYKASYTDQIELYWEDESAEYYKVEVKNGEETNIEVFYSNYVSVEDLIPNTAYQFRIRSNNSAWSEWVDIKTLMTDVYVMEAHPLTVDQLTHTDPQGLNSFYHSNQQITQLLKPIDQQHKVSFDLVDFYLEPGIDYLEIYNGDTDELITRISGDYYPVAPVVSTHVSGELKLVFYSDASNTGVGWVANASSIRKAPEAQILAITDQEIQLLFDGNNEFLHYKLKQNGEIVKEGTTASEQLNITDLISSTNYEVVFNYADHVDQSSFRFQTNGSAPLLQLARVYDSKAYFTLSGFDNQNMVTVLINDEELVFNATEELEIDNLEPSELYTIAAKFGDSEYSEEIQFKTRAEGLNGYFQLQPTEFFSKVGEVDYEVSIDLAYHNLDFDAPVLLDMEIVGMYETYQISNNSILRVVPQSNNIVSGVITKEMLEEIRDIPLGINVKMKNTDGTTVFDNNGEPFYLSFPFKIMAAASVSQGDESLNLTVSNASQVQEVILDGKSTPFIIEDGVLLLDLPEWLSQTDHYIRLVNDQFYDDLYFTVGGERVLDIPTLAITKDSTALSIAFDDVFAAEGYEIKCVNLNNQRSSSSVISNTNLTMDVEEATSYSIAIRTLFEDEITSEWSEPTTVYVNRVTFENPTISILQVVDNAISFEWNNIENAEFYSVQVEGIDQITELEADITSFELSDLTPNTTYRLAITTIYANDEKKVNTDYIEVTTIPGVSTLGNQLAENLEIHGTDPLLNTQKLSFSRDFLETPTYFIYDAKGHLIDNGALTGKELIYTHLPNGYYHLILKEGETVHRFPFVR
ncbi:GEVED domain-containing protein [Flammeovirga agarivorans]|uniref:Fibronectin type-III domain-containing protein n=1 Tax=Flammeovirga agarivorans TaxID=2726742 RepID=A0A7X8XTZ4_9BACT|nr:GEVED domain-containing protein [Flammeovirga agarivorans]NLR89882.1 hypothetical protein [Flammeovirga agarivorans]